ncbi:MAG: hypothetical protein GXP43_00520 [bacterium]|nr:hypothetical protein [bacterium]
MDFLKKTLVIITALSVFALVGLHRPIKAAESIFLTISPPINELILEPGSTSTHGLSLLNNSDSSITVDIRVSPFVPRGEEGQVNISDESLPDSEDWVVVYPGRITLEPKESKTISYTIKLPPNAPPGGFYFAIVASSSPHKYKGQGSQLEGGAAVVASVSELVLVQINGPVSYNATIEEFNTSNKKRFFSYGPVDFVARIKNLSNVHTVFSNQIEVENIIFPEKYLLKMKDQRILPNAVRKFTATVPNKWHIGYYKATLTTSYAGGNNLQNVIMFWIVPIKEITLILAGFALILTLIIILTRRSKHRAYELRKLQEAVDRLEEIEEKIRK